MPTPPPRHLARPRRPWRLLLVAFGLTTAVLAALVASATLLPPQAPSPQPAPGGALPTVTTQPAPTSTLTSTTTIQESNTVPSPSSSSPDTKPSTASRPIATTGRDTTADAPLLSDATASRTHSTPGATTPSSMTSLSITTAPSTTASTTTVASTTTTELTTTLLTTTTAEPTTSGFTTTSYNPTTTSVDPTTTSTEPTTTQSATTTTSAVLLGGSQPTGISAATAAGLLPVLGLLYLLRGLLPPSAGTHAKRRRTNRLRRN